MKTAKDIIAIIFEAGAEGVEQLKSVLQDGATLAMLDITYEDQAAVEEAYDMVMMGEEVTA